MMRSTDFNGIVTPGYADGGSISPTPRNSVLGAIADALAKTKDIANKWDLKTILPSIVREHLDEEPYGAGNLMGKLPDEVNEWSYGNLPMRMPPSGTGGYIPAFKPGRAESVADTLFGMQMASPVVKAGVAVAPRVASAGASALKGIADNALSYTPRAVSQLGAVRVKGGNFNVPRTEDWLSSLGVDTEGNIGNARQTRLPAVNTWANKQLKNYVSKDLGTPTDPLLAVEKDYPDLHMPAGRLDPQFEGNAIRMGSSQADSMWKAKAAHKQLTDEPLTPWGYRSSSTLDKMDVPAYTHEIGDIYDQQLPAWLEKPDLDPNTTIWAHPPGMSGYDHDPLHFGHVLDYLEAATEPHHTMRGLYGDDAAGRGFAQRAWPKDPKEIARADTDLAGILQTGDPGMTPLGPTQIRNWRDLNNAGLLLSPEQLQKTSVADAVRKTAQWNEWMANKSAEDGPLAQGWQVHKEYPDGMKWVKFTAPENMKKFNPDDLPKFAPDELPPGWTLKHEPMDIDASTGRPWEGGESDTHPWKLSPPMDKDGFTPGGYAYGTANTTREGAIKSAQEMHLNNTEMDMRKAINAHNGPLQEALTSGLNAEGDAMGHCVGGYCDEVAGNGTQIYSLRDAKNQPHVTVEVKASREDPRFDIPDEVQSKIDEYITAHPNIEAVRNKYGDWSDEYRDAFEDMRSDLYAAWDKANPLSKPDIAQIKGKQNEAPVEKYLPYVQDFVKNGQWGRVDDLHNTGLSSVGGKYFTDDELNAVWQKHYGAPVASADYLNSVARKDPTQLADVDRNALSDLGIGQDPASLQPGDTTPGYAHGGSVVPRYSKKRTLLARLPA